MEWLILLLCPLMMLFCMKGHGSKNHKHSHKSHSVAAADNIHSIDQYKMNELIGKVELLTEQNNQLKHEVKALKDKNEVS